VLTRRGGRGMKKLIVLLALCVLGCAPTKFFKAGITQEQAQHDYYECSVQAGAESWDGNPLILADQRAACMKARGYEGRY